MIRKQRAANGLIVLSLIAVSLTCATTASAAPTDKLWGARFPGTGGWDMAVSLDGSMVYVTGESGTEETGGDFGTVAYDADTGAELWTSLYNGTGNDLDSPLDLALSPDGTKVYVTGSSIGEPATGQDWATVAYDAQTGDQLWVARYSGPKPNIDIPEAVAPTPDGTHVLVTGASWVGALCARYVTISYDAETGDQQWLSSYPGALACGNGLAISPDGSTAFVTGTANDDYTTLAYDVVTGDQLWVSTYDGPGHQFDDAYRVAVAPDGGRLFVTGFSYGAGTNEDYATVAYEAATGDQAWAARYNGKANGHDNAWGLVLSPDGSRVFVTGGSGGLGPNNGDDYATIAYDAETGAGLWLKIYNGPIGADDEAQAIAVNARGTRVYVTGFSQGIPQGHFDYATLAYSAATGHEYWVRRFNGPAKLQDTAHAVAVSPDGATVYVTGGSESPKRGYNYVTWAYR